MMEDRVYEVLLRDGWSPQEGRRLASLMKLFSDLPAPPDARELFPHYGRLRGRFLEAADQGNGDTIEESFLELYAHLHMHEAPYTVEERQRVNATGGYWCHAGGLSPILKAAPFIRPTATSADLGAGNGLQGLLLQRLYPHRKTLQIEISSRMVEIGTRLQEWLEVPAERVEWVVEDLVNVVPTGIDFLYLYRPMRPEGIGDAFYRRLAAALAAEPREVVVFSIADCLRSYLDDRFEVFYSDGHLTCFRVTTRRQNP